VSEGEVDKALRELKEKGEMVIGPYREDDPASKSAGKGSVAQVLNGRAISLPQPTYPPIAVAAHASGTVVVEVILDLDGKVMAAQVVSGHPLLQAASLKAARLAQFSPTLLNGKPVRIIGNITYNFVARRKGL
jgi:protein TonB